MVFHHSSSQGHTVLQTLLFWWNGDYSKFFQAYLFTSPAGSLVLRTKVPSFFKRLPPHLVTLNFLPLPHHPHLITLKFNNLQ